MILLDRLGVKDIPISQCVSWSGKVFSCVLIVFATVAVRTILVSGIRCSVFGGTVSVDGDGSWLRIGSKVKAFEGVYGTCSVDRVGVLTALVVRVCAGVAGM